MRKYETGFILTPELSEEEIRDFLSGVRKFIEDSRGLIIKEEHWGRKDLAYRIGKFHQGNYYFFFYQGEPFIPKELERRFKQSEKVIRFLTVRLDDYLKKVEKMKRIEEKKKKKKEGDSERREIPFERLEYEGENE